MEDVPVAGRRRGLIERQGAPTGLITTAGFADTLEIGRERKFDLYDLDIQKPEPLVPGQPTRLRFELLDVLHRFKKGHRLMIQVQSTWFPLVDRNPQKFVPNIYFAKPEDYQKATHRLLRSNEHPSSIRLGVLPVAKGI